MTEEKIREVLTALRVCVREAGCDNCPYELADENCEKLQERVLELLEKAYPEE